MSERVLSGISRNRFVVVRCPECRVRSGLIDRMQEPGGVGDLRWWREHLVTAHKHPDPDFTFVDPGVCSAEVANGFSCLLPLPCSVHEPASSGESVPSPTAARPEGDGGKQTILERDE